MMRSIIVTLAFDSSPIKETFAKPTVIPAFAGIHNENPTWETKNHDTLSLFH